MSQADILLPPQRRAIQVELADRKHLNAAWLAALASTQPNLLVYSTAPSADMPCSTNPAIVPHAAHILRQLIDDTKPHVACFSRQNMLEQMRETRPALRIVL